MPEIITLPTDVEISSDGTGHFAMIPGLDFWGPCSFSPNHKYLLAWRDLDISTGVGGRRNKGYGIILLLRGRKVLLYAPETVQRPFCGKVSNTGNFCISDMTFSDGRTGQFFIFDKAGKEVVRHRTGANIYWNDISNNGAYAFCQCASNNGRTLSIMFDAQTGMKQWERQVETGMPEGIDFRAGKNRVALLYNGGKRWLYGDTDGKFLNSSEWEEEVEWNRDAFSLYNEAVSLTEQLKAGGPATLRKKIYNLLKRALHQGEFSDYPHYQAKSFRLYGEVCEYQNDITNAVKCYRKALKIDPKVGVKRRLLKLHKETAV